MSRCIASVVLTVSVVVSGCVTLDTTLKPHSHVPVGPVQQVHAAWENRLVVTQDAVNSGRPLVGLAGRIYLMEQFGICVQGQGMVAVELYDATQANADSQPKMIERFEIDKDTLKQLLRKDDIGWGYTVFLPWSTYRPEIARVQLQVRWVPEKGTPLFSPPAVVTLHGERTHQITSSQRRVAPGELLNSGLLPSPTSQSANRP